MRELTLIIKSLHVLCVKSMNYVFEADFVA